jgi:polyphenol oxidase
MADTALAAAFAAQDLDWIVPHWLAPARVHAFATTRNGGVSAEPHASLDLGGADDADVAPIVENRRRVLAFLPARPVWLAQVHGADVVHVDAHNVGALRAAPPRADALVTGLADVPLAIRVADCIPVLFAARDAAMIGAAHAGWRGLAAGVLEAALAALGVPASTVSAWLGPAIGRTAFEVGKDVYDAFVSRDAGAASAFAPLRDDKWLCDLAALARRRLEDAGIRDVAHDGACTFSDRRRFFSHRRDGATGRMAALIWQDRT